jgi:HAE1 family hydrophobic/amphiphilic exporter-1
MSSAIIGGQSLSLFLTLLATPVVYSWLDDLAHSKWIRLFGHLALAPVRLADRLFTRREPEEHAPAPIPQEVIEPVRTADGSPAE